MERSKNWDTSLNLSGPLIKHTQEIQKLLDLKERNLTEVDKRVITKAIEAILEGNSQRAESLLASKINIDENNKNQPESNITLKDIANDVSLASHEYYKENQEAIQKDLEEAIKISQEAKKTTENLSSKIDKKPTKEERERKRQEAIKAEESLKKLADDSKLTEQPKQYVRVGSSYIPKGPLPAQYELPSSSKREDERKKEIEPAAEKLFDKMVKNSTKYDGLNTKKEPIENKDNEKVPDNKKSGVENLLKNLKSGDKIEVPKNGENIVYTILSKKGDIIKFERNKPKISGSASVGVFRAMLSMEPSFEFKKFDKEKTTEDFLKNIQTDDQIETIQNGKVISYKIFSKNTDVIEYQTINGAKGSMSLDSLRKFLNTNGVSFKNLTAERDIQKMYIKNSVEDLGVGDKIEYFIPESGKTTTLTVMNVEGDQLTIRREGGDTLSPTIADLEKFFLDDADIASSIQFTRAKQPSAEPEESEQEAPTPDLMQFQELAKNLLANRKEIEELERQHEEVGGLLEIARQEDLNDNVDEENSVIDYKNLSQTNQDFVDLLGRGAVEESVRATQDAIVKEEAAVLENKEDTMKKLTRVELEKEIKENIEGLLNKIKEKKPEIEEFKLTSSPNGFNINSVVKINDTGKWYYRTATINLVISLEGNKDGILSLGNYSIEAGMATETAREELAPLMPQIVSGIKTYFEQKYNKPIESMKIENGELALHFKTT